MFIALSKKRLLNKINGPIGNLGMVGSETGTLTSLLFNEEMNSISNKLGNKRVNQQTTRIVNPMTHIENKTINLLKTTSRQTVPVKNNVRITEIEGHPIEKRTVKPFNIENDSDVRKNLLNNHASMTFTSNQFTNLENTHLHQITHFIEEPNIIKTVENRSINQTPIFQKTIHQRDGLLFSDTSTGQQSSLRPSTNTYEHQGPATNQFLQVPMDTALGQSIPLMADGHPTVSRSSNTYLLNKLENQQMVSSNKTTLSNVAPLKNKFLDSNSLLTNSTSKVASMNSVTNNTLSEKLVAHGGGPPHESESEGFKAAEPQLQGNGMQKFVEIINQDNTKKQDIQISLSLPNVNNGSSFMEELQSIVSSMS